MSLLNKIGYILQKAGWAPFDDDEWLKLDAALPEIHAQTSAASQQGGKVVAWAVQQPNNFGLKMLELCHEKEEAEGYVNQFGGTMRALGFIDGAPVQPVGTVDEQKEFEQWYVENAHDYEKDPIGSRDCGLQRKAWFAGRAALAAAPTPSAAAIPLLWVSEHKDRSIRAEVKRLDYPQDTGWGKTSRGTGPVRAADAVDAAMAPKGE